VHVGPWEWDVKRLAASAAVASAFLGGDRAAAEAAAYAAVGAYVRRINRCAEMGFLELWYDLIDERTILDAAPPHLRPATRAVLEKARARGHMRTLDRLTEQVNGRNRLIEDVPLIVREKRLTDGTPINQALDSMLRSYVTSLAPERRRLLARYRIADVARKVVGVGSVGTSCWVLLLEGLDSNDPLFLQVKEARESVLAPYLDQRSPVKNQGCRVVIGQRMIQGSPDIFLGWGAGAGKGHFYVRQLADMKGGIHFKEGDRKSLDQLNEYCALCGWALALAHAKSGDPAMIAGYCGTSDTFPAAVARFSLAYREQTQHDYDALAKAVRERRVAVAKSTQAAVG